jgi:hypothetical protein
VVEHKAKQEELAEVEMVPQTQMLLEQEALTLVAVAEETWLR